MAVTLELTDECLVHVFDCITVDGHIGWWIVVCMYVCVLR